MKVVSHAITFWKRYEHRLGVGALVVGFLFDLVLAKKPDSVTDNILLVSYLFIAASTIVILNLRNARTIEREHPSEPLLLLLMLQFCFGGLSSNLLVLYGKSGTLTVSAIFLALLVSLVFGNEYLRSRYSQLRFNVAVYYFLLLTYSIIAVPTFILHDIGVGVFFVSVLISLAVMAAFLFVLYVAVFRGDRKRLRSSVIMIVTIACVFAGLYVLNVIPPVPLSVKDIGMYHSVLKRSDGDYLVFYEPAPWWQFWSDTSNTFHAEAGQSAYCFSSVYAPTDLSVPIYHRWEFNDPSSNSWVTESRVSFSISGGRAQGYRGFSVKAGLTPGQWRCDVETETGALIGRTTFSVVEGTSTNLSTATL